VKGEKMAAPLTCWLSKLN